MPSKCRIVSWKNNWSSHDMPRNFAVMNFIEWTSKHGINKGDELGITYAGNPEIWGSWNRTMGNYEYINNLFKTHSWSDINQVSQVNEERNMVQCWILVRKKKIHNILNTICG